MNRPIEPSSHRAIASAVASALAMALVGSGRAAAAAPAVDTSEWLCKECPFEDAAARESEIEAGAGHVGESSARFGRYDGRDRDGPYLVLDARAQQRFANGSRWRAEARELGLDARAIELEAARPSWRLRLGFTQSPNNLLDTTRTPYAASEPGRLSLPSGFVRAGSTTGMRTLEAALQPVRLGSERRALHAGVRGRLGERWQSYARYRREEREGTLRLGAAFGFSAVELPRPVDDLTDAVELGARFAGERLSATIGYEGSFYSNRRSTLSFDNAYLGPGVGRVALEPDNASQQLLANLNLRVGSASTLAATAAVGELRQDDEFAPYSTGLLAGAVGAPLPRSSLDARVDTVHAALRFATALDALTPWLRTARVRLEARWDERDDATSQALWRPIVTDFFTSTSSADPRYAFEHLRIGANADYDLRTLLRFLPESQRLRISGGWRRDEIERNLQEGTDSTEDTGWGRVSWKPGERIDLAVRWGGANREIDRYRALDAPIAPQNPLLRKYHMADRERQFADGTLTLQPHARLALVASGRYANDDYVNSRLGLRAARERGATLGATWTPFEGAAIYADHGWERITARQSGSESFAAPDWFARSEDRFRTATLGFRIDGIGGALDLDARAFVADSSGDTLVLGAAGGSALPPLRTRMNGAEIGLAWRRNAALELRARIRYEHFDADDYALDGVASATVPTLLSLGAEAWDYDVASFVLSFRYRVDGAAERDTATLDAPAASRAAD